MSVASCARPVLRGCHVGLRASDTGLLAAARASRAQGPQKKPSSWRSCSAPAHPAARSGLSPLQKTAHTSSLQVVASVHAAPRTALPFTALSAQTSIYFARRCVATSAQSTSHATQSGASAKAGTFPWVRTGSIVVAVALAAGLSISRLKAQEEYTSDKPSKTPDAERESRFARSVEEMESEEKREHGNALIRVLYGIGDTLQDYILEPLGTARRFVVLVLLFAPVILTMPMLLVGRRREGGRLRGRRLPKSEGGERWGALWWYGFLVKQMERAGPTFIKLAQWAGSRQDLFPKDLCDLLGKLHSNGKPHSLKYTKKVIESVFGRPFDEVFEDFPDEPLGIGAVAQVYKATLRPDLLPSGYLEQKHNRRSDSRISQELAIATDEDRPPPVIPTASVAIKILHPKVHRTIGRDIKIMSFFARLINAFPGAEWLSFPEEVDVFAEMMFSQLDLRNEADNLDRFEKNFMKRDSPISFPRPLIEFTSKEILIEEYEDAVPLKHFLNLGGASFDNRIANLGLDAFLSMLLLDNFTHADLHPGNIMVKFYRPTTKTMLRHLLTRILSKFDADYAKSSASAGSTDVQTDESVVRELMSLKKDQDAWLDELERLDALGYQPELVFLDAGLTVELTPTNRRNFLDLFGAVAEFNGALAGHLMVERCRLPELVIDEDTFALKMQDLVLSVKSKTFSLAKIKIGDVLSQVLAAVREHHVKMEADFVNTVISILLLEGIGRQLDPNMDLFKSALPILRNLGREMARQEGSGMLSHGQDLKNLSPMIKLWFWMEARSWVLGIADKATVDAFVRYDWLSTAA